MSEPKWTPGPWEQASRHVFAPGPTGANICVVGEPRASTIVSYTELELGSADAPEAYANARLIAAAPELHAALAEMVEAYWRGSEDNDDENAPHAVKLALAALAKACGETP